MQEQLKQPAAQPAAPSAQKYKVENPVNVPECEEVLVKIRKAEKKRMVQVCSVCWCPPSWEDCPASIGGGYVLEIAEDDPSLHDGLFHGDDCPEMRDMWERFRKAGGKY